MQSLQPDKKKRQPLKIPVWGTSPRVSAPDSQHSQPQGNPSLRGSQPQARWETLRWISLAPGSPGEEEKAGELRIIFVFLTHACGLLRKPPRYVLISDGLPASRPSGSQGNHALADCRILFWNTSLGINTQQKGVCPPGRWTVCSRGWQPRRSLLPRPSSSAWQHQGRTGGWDTEGQCLLRPCGPPSQPWPHCSRLLNPQPKVTWGHDLACVIGSNTMLGTQSGEISIG